jgi:hypothetical protein
MKVPTQEFLRIIVVILAFLIALDACIAINRWWRAEGDVAYVRNLAVMTVGFAVFSILASKSKTELLGLIFLCIAIYFISNYEIGGPSKYYLTPFDYLLGLSPAFQEGDLTHVTYRKIMVVSTSILAIATLVLSRWRRRSELSTGQAQHEEQGLLQH